MTKLIPPLQFVPLSDEEKACYREMLRRLDRGGWEQTAASRQLAREYLAKARAQ